MSYMIRSNSINLLNTIIKRESIIDYTLNKLLRRRLARQELELEVYSPAPRCNNQERDL